TVQQNDLKSVEQVGNVPDAFKKVIENNIFCCASAFDGSVLKSEVCSADKENRTKVHQIWMMDLYGNELATYVCNSDYAYHVRTLTATSDGGFLFVLGFEDCSYGMDVWASDKGFASRVLKFDKRGNLQFDIPFAGVEGSALDFCIEKNGQFYFFGESETPETKKQGIHSSTDISMCILDKNGNILKQAYITGTDYDSLYMVETRDDLFVLSVSSQSQDGDFVGSNSGGYPVDWVFAVNADLEIVKKEKETGREYFDYRIGEKDGVWVHRSDPLLKNFDAGTPDAFIDYGDFYLIVSENNTGIYENTPPTISSIWYYTETVYSAYDYDGKLIFRTSVDSSPDYDALAKELTS
ncbi:MAG: hypothetical protein IJX37_09625, partial [Oscillospiraceae bacterium]|nr:hypothetical protein [Oscillospiraceae bacterium]